MSEFGRFEALSFDCYGTLIDWETGIANAVGEWAHRRNASISREESLGLFAVHETAVQQERPDALYPEVLAETLVKIGAELGVAVRDADAAAFGNSVGDWPAFDDSADALAQLKQRYKLIILSNVDRTSFAQSNDRLGVEFDMIVTAQDVGAYKPSPKSFPAMFERLTDIGVERESLLHVAQSLYHDHVPAQVAGLETVWIDRQAGAEGHGATPPAEATPTWRFETLAEFATAVG